MENNLSQENYSLPFNFNIQSFEIFITERLHEMLAHELSLQNHSLRVNLFPPSPDAACQCLLANQTLTADLTVSWSGSDHKLQFTFPFPWHGVFVFRSESSTSNQAERWIWHPRLVGKPGVWLLRDFRGNPGEWVTRDSLQVVFLDSSQLEVGEKSRCDPRKRLVDLLVLKNLQPAVEGNIPEFRQIVARYLEELESCLDEGGGPAKGLEFIRKKPLEKLLAKALKNRSEQEISDGVLNSQDLSWQRLDTFSAFLINRLMVLFCRKKIYFHPENSKPETKSDSFLWDALSELSRETLIPSGIKNRLTTSGRFHYFDPVNGIDALSRLTSFQRYNYRTEVLERLPAVYRQNHPSFSGFVCPVESPESKKVGLTLHLARGVKCDLLGRMRRTTDTVSTPEKNLGYGASLVPFYHYNDGPRAMMGAKNLKQAVPIKGCADPVIATGCEKVVAKAVKPLIESGLVPTCSWVAPGVDLLVAYLPWFGWNMEDAIVANSRLVEQQVLDWEKEETFSKYIRPGFKLTGPEFSTTLEEAFKVFRYGEDHLHKPGPISPDTPVAFFRHPETGEKQPVLCGGNDPGELDSIKYYPPEDSYLGGKLVWKVASCLPLMVGDKLMGRYGNKGVVSKLLPPDEMPRLPDDSRLAEELRGRPVDLILNPHGVISRMNLGQLLETQLGLLQRLCPQKFNFPAGFFFLSN